jgi:hypothetical protein
VADTSVLSEINPGDTLLIEVIVTPEPNVVALRTSVPLIL